MLAVMSLRMLGIVVGAMVLAVVVLSIREAVVPRTRATLVTAGVISGVAGTATFTLAGGRRITVEAEGTFDRPYEPFHRGGLNQVRFRADDGRTGTAIYELTGARHHRYFPATVVEGVLPT